MGGREKTFRAAGLSEKSDLEKRRHRWDLCTRGKSDLERAKLTTQKAKELEASPDPYVIKFAKMFAHVPG
ncbi:MAG: hypothetical protein R2861_05805 [Desulfobacterales bacterium]